MQQVKASGITFLAFNHLLRQKQLRHGVSLRGQSGDTTGGKKISFDFSSREPVSAGQNVRRFCEALGLKAKNVVRAKQVHGSTVAVVQKAGQL